MSAGKNPILRYGIIDQCLTSKVKRYWSPDDLIRKFEEFDLFIELRTLKYDLQNMRENSQLGYFAPVEYCRRNKGYHYTEATYSIYGDRLSQKDLMSLTFVLNLVEQVEGAALLEQVKGTLSKLNKTARATRPSPIKHPVLSIDPNTFYKGRDHLVTLIDAIFQGQPLTIVYHKFNSPQAGDYVFHPYQLKLYSDRWYVRGFSEKHQDIIILALDRIERIEPCNIPYHLDDALHDKEYFLHTIGITKGNGPVEEIELAFTPSQAPYIRTRHLHHTQRILKDDADGMIISLQLIQNYELCQLLLSLMPTVKVLKPVSLREKILDLLQQSLVMNQ